jgi:NADH-quinone oxidoreductase subunit L
MTALLICLTLFIPWTGALVVWLVGDSRPKAQHLLASAFALAAGASALALLPFASDQPAIALDFGPYFGALTFVPDGLGLFLTCVASVIGSLAVIFSMSYMHGEAQLGRYYFFVLFFIGSMVGLALSGSLLFLFVFWELTALCSYALISFYNDDPRAVAGGIKALIITQVGGVGLLAGALLCYAYLGSYDIRVVLERSGELPAPVLSILAFGFLIAAAAKSAQFPFQTWLPDAMEAPTPISALIHAATMVNAGVYLLARFYPAFAPVPDWNLAVMLVGAISALMAGMMALVATDLKRVLAYSTVSQLGIMVYAVGTGAIFASQFHLLSHAVFKALLFLGAGAVIHTVGTRDMRQMGGLGRQLPFVQAVFVCGALALAGIPILNGFWSKELVLEAGLEHGPNWVYLLMLLGAGLTACYTLRMVWMVFWGEPNPAVHLHDAPRPMRLALAPLAIGAWSTWLLAGPFSQLLAATLPAHEIEPETTLEMVSAVLTAPATYVTLGVAFLGLAAWQGRAWLGWLQRLLAPLGGWAAQSFGFEWLNQRIVGATRSAAENLSVLQTGALNWNLVGVIGGLIFILAWLAFGL